MVEFQHIKEYLSTALGTEGSLLIPKKIMDTLIAETEKALIPRSEAAMYLGPSSFGIGASSIDVDLETPDSLQVRQTGEGAEFVMDAPAYTTFNIKPAKYGVAIRITREMLEDAKWNLLQRTVKLSGKRLAENENSLIITALDSAANTVSGGAAVSIANVTRAMQHLEDADYAATTFAVGSEVVNDLRNIDTFAEVDKSGSNEMLAKGFVGVIYGMKVFRVSTNAGMTTTSAYVFDRDFGYMIVEKRPVTIENFDLPLIDSSAAVVSQRLAVKNIRSAAVAKITSS